MGTTTRQRAWRKLREAKRVLQVALEGGYLDLTGRPQALAAQADALLAGAYPATVEVHCAPEWNGQHMRTLSLCGYYDTPAGLRIVLKKLKVLQVCV